MNKVILNEKNIGDEVVVTTSYNTYISKIIAVTPKGFIKIKNGTLFHPNGWERTSRNFGMSSIRLLTDEVKQELEEDKLKTQLILDIKDGIREIERTLAKDMSIQKIKKIHEAFYPHGRERK